MRYPIIKRAQWTLFFLTILILVACNIFSFLYDYHQDKLSTNEDVQLIKAQLSVTIRTTSIKDDVIEHIHTPGFQAVGKTICRKSGQGLLILIAVLSSAAHIKQRMTIRKTWGLCTKRRDVDLVFVIGHTINETLVDEMNIYQDLIITNNPENQYEVLQTISILEYVKRYCSRVIFLLKTVDSAYINMPVLYPLLDHSLSNSGISGKYHKYESRQYLNTTSLGYISGSTYVMVAVHTRKIYEQVLREVYIPDVGILLNGIVAEKVGVLRTNMKELSTVDDPVSDMKDYSRKAYIHLSTLKEFYNVWTLLSARLLDY